VEVQRWIWQNTGVFAMRDTVWRGNATGSPVKCVFRPRRRFRAKREETWEPYILKGRGRVYSFSVVRQPPEGFDDQPPYLVALVRLDEGPMVTAQLTDCDPDQVAIDMPVEMVTRRLRALGPTGLIVYGYKFRPIVS
jgi:uncharacterized OB-fold protein